MPEAGPRQRKTSPRRKKSSKPGATSRAPSSRREVKQRKRQKRVEEAAKLCHEVATDGWQQAVATRATNYITGHTWERLFSARKRRNCKAFARLAAKILSYKQKLHGLAGALGAWLAGSLGGGRLVRAVAKELAAAIPLPTDAKMVAVARGLQLTGILLCLANGDDLTRCQCFIDLALNETKDRLKKLLAAAVDDWARLPDRVPLSKELEPL
ncbi:hypothetical protein [Amycolatopsis sp. NPDC058986]|uniref:hypothetical protein n=1 Tax=unclassified Amycolatopsis TaxID=2618356 RepID=UPI00366BD4A6